MAEAAGLVSDGARLAIGGFPVFQRPMAFVRELVRQQRQSLVIVGTVNGLDVDLLAGAGCVARVETSYVGLEQFGLARNFRRRVEAGEIGILELSEEISFDRFRATLEGWTFLPAGYLAGTDVAASEEVKEIVCPFTGRRYAAFRPADPDVVVVHAPAADEFGNVLVSRNQMLPQSIDLLMTRACSTVIVTVEEIVTNTFVRRHPELTQIPAFRTTCVVEAPWGCHPTSMFGFYELDDAALEEYTAASSAQASFDEYLDTYVRPLGHDAYIEAMGARRLTALRRWLP